MTTTALVRTSPAPPFRKAVPVPENARTALPARTVALAVTALAMGGLGIGTTEFAIMGLLQEATTDLGVSIPEGGHLISAYALGVVVGAPLLAAFGARLPRKTLLLILMAMFTVGNLSSVLAGDYGSLLVTRFVSGLPHGAYFGVAATTAASLVSVSRRARAVSMVMVGLSVANVVGVPAVTWLGQTYGWRWMFTVVGIIGALTFAAILLYVPFRPAASDAGIRSELRALKRAQMWLALLVGMVGFGGFFAVYSYISPVMTDVAGMEIGLLPMVVGLYGLGMLAGNVLGGRLADWSVMGAIYCAMTAVVILLVLFGALAHIQFLAWLLLFLIGAAGSSLIPALQTRLMDVSPGAQSLAASLNHSALNVANALGAFLGGAVIALGWGYRAPALVGAALALLGLGVAVFSGRLDNRAGRRSPDQALAAASAE